MSNYTLFETKFNVEQLKYLFDEAQREIDLRKKTYQGFVRSKTHSMTQSEADKKIALFVQIKVLIEDQIRLKESLKRNEVHHSLLYGSPLLQEIKTEAERELAMRKKVYPRLTKYSTKNA